MYRPVGITRYGGEVHAFFNGRARAWDCFARRPFAAADGVQKNVHWVALLFRYIRGKERIISRSIKVDLHGPASVTLPRPAADSINARSRLKRVRTYSEGQKVFGIAKLTLIRLVCRLCQYRHAIGDHRGGDGLVSVPSWIWFQNSEHFATRLKARAIACMSREISSDVI